MRFFVDSLRGVVLAALFAGCDSGAVVERSAEPGPQAAEETSEVGAAVQETPSRAPLQRGKLLGGEPVERAPEWPIAGDSDTAPGPDRSPELQRAIEASSVPVLLPVEMPWSEQLTLIPLGDNGYSLRARADRSKLILQASGVARLYDDLPGDRGKSQIRGVEGHLTENEGILSASWIERRTSYTADLECGDPEAAECNTEGFLRLLSSLSFVEAPPEKLEAKQQGDALRQGDGR